MCKAPAAAEHSHYHFHMMMKNILVISQFLRVTLQTYNFRHLILLFFFSCKVWSAN
jgi:hypothetical protein